MFSFRRKNSTRTTSSRESAENMPENLSSTSKSQRERLTDAQIENPFNQNTGRNSFLNPSPATRRPDRPGMNAFTVPSNEPPPAYTASPIETSDPTLGALPTYTGLVQGFSPPSPSNNSIQSEDLYAFLKYFDTLLLIDDSGSMIGQSWQETAQALSQLLPIIVARDTDGIDIFFLNHTSSDLGSKNDGVAPGGYRNVQNVAQVQQIFNAVKPRGGTPTGTRCNAILEPYLNRLETAAKNGTMDNVKPLNIIVITDGVPSDDVESVIIRAAKKLDHLNAVPYQVGVQFFQIGNENGAAEALQDLDDELGKQVHGGIRDIVDTCKWIDSGKNMNLTAEGILKVVLGAVVKRLDRKPTAV